MPNKSGIVDDDELGAWLSDKPLGWAQAIAARNALRVFPLVFFNKSISDRGTLDPILSVWRANFLSWAACKYPTRDMAVCASNAAIAVRVTTNPNANAAVSASAAAAKAAAESTRARVTSSAIAAVRDTTSAGVRAVEAAVRADGTIPSYETTGNILWEAVNADCQYLLSGRADLIEQPLWLIDVRGESSYVVNFPIWVRRPFDEFADSSLANSTSWNLIASWYRALLPNPMGAKPRSLFGERADVQIAMKPAEFWDHAPQLVMAAIATIARWEPDNSGLVPASNLDKMKSVSKSASDAKAKSTDASSPELNDPETLSPAKDKLAKDQRLREDVRTHSDEPTARDRLGRRPFAQALVERMDDVRAQGAPDGFAVHIHAPWGAGKTSILMMMEQAMTDPPRPPNRQWAVVHFNAWKNERRKPPWWPLIQQTYACCRDNLRKEWSLSRWLSVKSCWMFWRFRADWFPYLVAVLAFSAILFFWWSSNSPSPVSEDGNWSGLIHDPGSGDIVGSASSLPEPTDGEVLWSAFSTDGVDKILKIVTALVAGFAAFVGVGRAIVFGSPNNAKFYTDLSSDPLKRIAKLFRSIVVKTDKPVAIFIDDLDRCHADYVVDLLEGIQTLFRGRNVAYVVAADRGWIKAAFESRYGVFSGDVGDVGQPLGYLFLEKIFQISTPVPGMGAQIRQEYWDRLIEGDRAPVVPGDVDRQLDLAKAEETETKVQEEFDRRVTEVRQELKTESGGKVTSASVDEFLSRRGGGAEIRAAAALEINVSAAAEREAEHLLSRFQGIVGEVPRVMKRMINAFAMRRAIGILEGSAIPQEALVRWTILEQRWPALADLLISNPEWVNDLGVKQSEAKLAKLEPALQPFANRPPVQSVLGKKTDGGLTPELVSAIVRGSASDSS